MFIRKAIPFLYLLILAFFSMALLGKLMHWHNLMFWFTGCVITQYMFAFAAIYEIKWLEAFTQNEKSTWSSLLLVCPVISGIAYLKKTNNWRLETGNKKY